MNCLWRVSIVLLASALVPLVSPAQQGNDGSQGSVALGDVARKARSKSGKSAAKVFTNDDLAGTGNDFHNGAARSATAPDTPANTDAAAKASSESDQSANTADKEGADVKQREKDFRARYLKLKNSLELAERELKVSQRENEIKAAEFYSDAGRQLRDSKSWTEQQQKLKEETTAKQREVDKAKDALEALKEDGRKAGVPSGTFEK